MRMQCGAVVLLAQAPVAGQVKTRLGPLVPVEDAARLHGAFVADLLEMLASLRGVAEVELATDGEPEEWRDLEIPQTVQAEQEPGERILAAFARHFALERCPVVILGSDSPTLPASHVLHLLRAKADLAFGPTEKGGFYAIACRRTQPEMFREVIWSSPFALETALSAARRCGLSVELGPRWFDVDEPRDLDRLRACRHLPRHTAAWFESWAG